jgi:hypothetical protein
MAGMRGIGEPLQVRGDAGADPTLDACCAREVADEAAQATRLELIRAENEKRGLGFAPHRKYLPAQTLGLARGAGQGAIPPRDGRDAADGDYDKDDDEDDDDDDDLAFLDELDAEGSDDDELGRLRDARIAELKQRQSAERSARERRQQPGGVDAMFTRFGEVGAVALAQLLRLVRSSDRVVCFLGLAAAGGGGGGVGGGVGGGEGLFVGEQGGGGGGADRLLVTALSHAQRLSLEWGGTLFVRTAVSAAQAAGPVSTPPPASSFWLRFPYVTCSVLLVTQLLRSAPDGRPGCSRCCAPAAWGSCRPWCASARGWWRTRPCTRASCSSSRPWGRSVRRRARSRALRLGISACAPLRAARGLR